MDLNTTIKRQIAEWIKSFQKYTYKRHTLYRDINVKGWKKTYYVTRKPKRSKEAIPILDQKDFKIKIITRGKEVYFIEVAILQ